jgi:hypothetical protein
MSAWASVTEESALTRTAEMAAGLNCPTGSATQTDRKAMLKCLRSVTAADLTEYQEIYYSFFKTLSFEIRV